MNKYSTELQGVMDTILLERVRTGCKAVAQRATHVQINYDRVPSYAASLPLEAIAHPVLDPHNHYLGHGDDTVAFFITLDPINFGSGYFPDLRKRPGMSGYFTVASSLNDYYQEKGPLTAQDLRRLSQEDCAQIFGQYLDNQPILLEMLALFVFQQYFSPTYTQHGQKLILNWVNACLTVLDSSHKR